MLYATDKKTAKIKCISNELRRLCTRLLVPFTESVKNAYRDFTDSAGAYIAPEFKQIQCSLACLPVSTASCERGFSKMNVVCAPLRATLTVEICIVEL